jgi:uncharacterized protein
MNMHGEQHVAASRQHVWDALNNPEILRACIPGCQELTKSSATEMTAVAVIKVGPVTARFQGAVTLSDLDPPNGYKITGEGQGGVAGFAKGTATVRLESVDDGTLLHYQVEAQIGGKLSQLGGRLIDATAKKMSGLFFEKFAQEIRARQSLGDAQAATSTDASPAASSGPIRGSTARTKGNDVRPTRSSGEHRQPLLSSFAKYAAVAALACGAMLIWLRCGGLLPGLVAATNSIGTDGRAHISPDLAGLVQLVMAAAIGYLFGTRGKTSSGA